MRGRAVWSRRRWIAGSIASAGAAAGLGSPAAGASRGRIERVAGAGVKIALNVYSFNRPLRAGDITLPQVVEFCARQGLASLDATGYYFPGYPAAPPDDYVYALKRKGFLNGVAIHGTGVRNDFAVDDPEARRKDVALVKAWIDVAQKLGASVIRVFSGRRVPEGRSFDEVLEWMVPAMQECARYGGERGVIVGVQNHNDFLKTAAETIRLVEAVDSEWFGVVLDVGSLRQSDPYEEIEKLVPYAVSWQLKENVWYGERAEPTDLARIKSIIDRHGYRGVLPIETLGPGDPKQKVTAFLARVREVFEA